MLVPVFVKVLFDELVEEVDVVLVELVVDPVSVEVPVETPPSVPGSMTAVPLQAN